MIILHVFYRIFIQLILIYFSKLNIFNAYFSLLRIYDNAFSILKKCIKLKHIFVIKNKLLIKLTMHIM